MLILTYMNVDVQVENPKNISAHVKFHCRDSNTFAYQRMEEDFSSLVDIGKYINQKTLCTNMSALHGKVRVISGTTLEFEVLVSPEIIWNMDNVIALCMYSTDKELLQFRKLMEDIVIPRAMVEKYKPFPDPPSAYDRLAVGIYLSTDELAGYHKRHRYCLEATGICGTERLYFTSLNHIYKNSAEEKNGIWKIRYFLSLDSQYIRYNRLGLYGSVKTLNQSSTFYHVVECIPELVVIQEILALAM